TLGLATGSTPQKMYQYLAEMLNENNINLSNVHTVNLDEYVVVRVQSDIFIQIYNINLSNVHTVNLDEYVGLDADNAQSYHYFMLEEFFNKVNIPLENTHIPDGKNDDLEAEVANYEKIIADIDGIDLQVLIVGRIGHISFNEPVTTFDSRTQVVSLTDVTIKDNSRFFDKIEDVPTQALSMGLETIMDAKSILFLASGEAKRDAVNSLINAEITEEIPVTILQKHDNLTVILDKDVLGE